MVPPNGSSEDAPASAAEPAWIEAGAPLLPRALKRTFTLPANLWRHRALWLAGARRELKARLSGTVLGRLWPLVQPLALFGVYYALFARVFRMRFPSVEGGSEAATAVYLFIGVVVWSAFADGLARGTVAFTERGELLKRAAFPAEVLPFQAVVAQQWLMLLALAVFLVVAAATGTWPAPGPAIALVPLLVLLQALFTLGLSLVAATLHAYLRDTAHIVSVLAMLWMFATPIFWIPSASILPGVEPFLPWLAWNPMHAFLACWRAALMNAAPPEAFTAPLEVSLAHASLWTAGALLAGGFVFSLGERRIPDEI